MLSYSIRSPPITIHYHCKNTKVESPLLESFLTNLLRSNHAAACSITNISIISDNARSTRPMLVPQRSINNHTRLLESAHGLLAYTQASRDSSVPARPAHLFTTNKKQDEVKSILRWKSLSDESLSLPKRKNSCESIPSLRKGGGRRRPARSLSLQHDPATSQVNNGSPSLLSLACAAKRREHSSDKSLALPTRKSSCESFCRRGAIKSIDEQSQSISASHNASFSFESAATLQCISFVEQKDEASGSQLPRRERRNMTSS
jgi:hypothetical protein